MHLDHWVEPHLVNWLEITPGFHSAFKNLHFPCWTTQNQNHLFTNYNNTILPTCWEDNSFPMVMINSISFRKCTFIWTLTKFSSLFKIDDLMTKINPTANQRHRIQERGEAQSGQILSNHQNSAIRGYFVFLMFWL